MTSKTPSSQSKPNHPKAWSGRFKVSDKNEAIESFNASISFDKTLATYDIEGSLAHAQMLKECGIIPKASFEAIKKGLNQIKTEVKRGEFNWKVEAEDVHMNIEARLIELIGEDGKKLHTARSRNDQVATDLRLYLRDKNLELIKLLNQLLHTLIIQAEKHADWIMPGFTHLQSAQPVLVAHHLLAWFEMIWRDKERFEQIHHRINVLPLGSAALAGSPYPINRQRVAELLGFDSVCQNSLDGVSDRDFAIEWVQASALLGVHYSRICEEVVLWASSAFNLVEVSEHYSTGSSIMPQKKNPDIAELIRGKSARLMAHSVQMLSLMKSLPLAYNKDMQEDKEAVFDSVSTAQACTQMLEGMIAEIQFKRVELEQMARKGFSNATDIADYLVGKGVSFRQAHYISGQLVQKAIERGVFLDDLSLDEFKQQSSLIESDIFERISLEKSISQRSHIGGTAYKAVAQAIKQAKNRLQTHQAKP